MTNQEKIQFLRPVSKYIAKVEMLKRDLIRWRELGEKVTPSLTGMPQGGQNVPKVEQSAIMICDIEKEINERIKQLSELYMRILSAIDAVDDINLQNLLYRRYIQGQKWEKIAVEMHYSYMHVCRLHGQALDKIML